MSNALFAALPHSARQHFALYHYAAMLRLIGQATVQLGTPDAMRERFPFLGGYLAEIGDRVLPGRSPEQVMALWRDAIDAWERASPVRLPLAALRAAGHLTHDDITLLAQIGLPDEDPRAGSVIATLQGGDVHPTRGLLAAAADGIDARGALFRLEQCGLIEAIAPASPVVRPCPAAWDAVRGDARVAAGWARYRPADALLPLEALHLPEPVRQACRRAAPALASGAAAAAIVRGPRHNGRSAIAAALARALGKGIVDVSALDAGDPRWRQPSATACLLDAALLAATELAPADVLALPDIDAALAPLFVTCRAAAGVTGPLADRAIILEAPIPDRELRRTLWSESLGMVPAGVDGLRLTSGNIVRAARVARAGALVTGETVDGHALRAAVRTLDRSGLETTARRVETIDDWSRLSVGDDSATELRLLVARCRHRERLAEAAGASFASLGPGVCALFKGPSGTGKTLAARLVAGTLGMDLYRLDLAAVVNKYIGETEKNLERVFALAEELDVVLLLDEGDALLGQRTGVQNATDRYANLETNYLLQRLESYEGILIVTTNANDRIDRAFQRRMDVTIEFGVPDASERWDIWQGHLPASHSIGLDALHAAAQRCVLSGGQIRNAALHASLLALEEDATVTAAHLETAIEREYRKQGGLSPLRGRSAVR